MKYRFMIFIAFTLLSCEQPIPITPVKTTTTIAPTPVIVPEVVLGPEYTPFSGDFIYADGRGFTVLVSFLGGDDVLAVCITANATVYLRYDMVLDNGTLTTYDGAYPIIWWFQCVNFPYRWDNADTLVVTDPVNNRVLALRRR